MPIPFFERTLSGMRAVGELECWSSPSFPSVNWAFLIRLLLLSKATLAICNIVAHTLIPGQ